MLVGAWAEGCEALTPPVSPPLCCVAAQVEVSRELVPLREAYHAVGRVAKVKARATARPQGRRRKPSGKGGWVRC